MTFGTLARFDRCPTVHSIFHVCGIGQELVKSLFRYSDNHSSWFSVTWHDRDVFSLVIDSRLIKREKGFFVYFKCEVDRRTIWSILQIDTIQGFFLISVNCFSLKDITRKSSFPFSHPSPQDEISNDKSIDFLFHHVQRDFVTLSQLTLLGESRVTKLCSGYVFFVSFYIRVRTLNDDVHANFSHCETLRWKNKI